MARNGSSLGEDMTKRDSPRGRALTVPQNSSTKSSGSSPVTSQAPDSDLRLTSVRRREPCEVDCDQDSVADSSLFEWRRWRRRHQRRNFNAATDGGGFAGANDFRQNLFAGYVDRSRQGGHRPCPRRRRRGASRTGYKGTRRNITTTSSPDQARQEFEPAWARSQRQEIRGLVSRPPHQEPTDQQQEYRPREIDRWPQAVSTPGGLCRVVESVEPHDGMRRVVARFNPAA